VLYKSTLTLTFDMGWNLTLLSEFETCSCALYVVLLRIPSSHPNLRTFSEFVRVQILGFLAAENDSFETCVRKIFHLISQIYTTKTPSDWHWCHFHLPIDILQQQHSSACCLREVLICAICGHLMYGYQTTRL